jgi:hypothetical protein
LQAEATVVTTQDFITELFCCVDDQMKDVLKHPQSQLYPSEIVTLAFLFAIKGVGNRPFYRWLVRDFKPLFPNLPERTRLFRLFKTHRAWTQAFMAEPTVLGVIDSYGIELIHPIREGRSKRQYGRKGLSNRRWIVGGKLCLLLNKLGLVVAWDCDTANVSEQDHRFIKKKVRASQCFKSFHTAERTLEGIEAVNMLRKGQVKRLAGSDAQGQAKFVESLFLIAA